MAQRFPWVGATLASAGIMGVGYLLLKATVPTPEQSYAAMAPDLRRQVDANRAARIAKETLVQRQMNAQMDDPDSQKPIWADPPTNSRK